MLLRSMVYLNRRQFIRHAAAASLYGMLPAIVRRRSGRGADLPAYHIRTLTTGPRHHFFGYYGMPPWNASGSHLVCLEVPFQDRLPEPDEPAAIGVVDPQTGAFAQVGETYAWNLQQGALLHWNPLNPETEILFNDRDGARLVATVLDVRSGHRRRLPRPISAAGRTGNHALSLTYGRLARLRKVVGYAGAEDPNPDVAHPDNDGVFALDLESGATRLIVSIGEVYRRSVEAYPVLAERHMWFNHTVFNPSGTRFLFLARSWTPDRKLDSAMFTANTDGSGLRQVIPYGSGVSHFDWRNDREIIATFRLPGKKEYQHILFADDGPPGYQVIGDGFLIGDGHCTFAPGGRWLATDRKHGESLSQSLWLYDVAAQEGMVLTMLPMKEKIFLGGDTRCDFHPRWNRTGDVICFDALDTRDWTRQLHVAELDF